MKPFQAILAALMIFVGPSAFAQGPFSNGLYSFDQGGVFTVMFVSQDGVGAGRFAQNNSDIIPRNAIAYFFYRGVTYVGWNYGEVRPELNLAVGAANLRANLIFETENNFGGVTLDDEMGAVNGGSVENRRGVCNIGWKAKVPEYGQMTRFEGKGDVVVFGDQQLVTVDPETGATVDTDFQVRHRQEVRVYGSRINWVGPTQFFGGAEVSTQLSLVP